MTAPRVLLVNHADLGGGGAAVAGYRLHRALRDVGVPSSMVVGARTTADPDVSVLRQLGTLRRPLRAAARRAGLNELDGISAYGLHRRADFLAADVVHYHAIHGSWFSYPAMKRLTRAKPSVLTLHDMWPLTGHCSFSFECDRWRSGCGSCPHPEAFPAIERDATALEWRLKDRVWAASELTIVSPSRWLADISRESMLGRFPVEVIPHGIDTDAYAPSDPAAARAALRIDGTGPVLMFGASSVQDHRKGGDLVLTALGSLPAVLRKSLTVLLMGGHGGPAAAALRYLDVDAVDMGYVPGDRLKALLYSAADVFVFPTRADNAPLVTLEALACGTPVVSFDVGGVGETVRHGENGLLAPPGEAGALAAALEELIEDGDRRAGYGAAGRRMVLAEHPAELAARRHLQLYARLGDR